MHDDPDVERFVKVVREPADRVATPGLRAWIQIEKSVWHDECVHVRSKRVDLLNHALGRNTRFQLTHSFCHHHPLPREHRFRVKHPHLERIAEIHVSACTSVHEHEALCRHKRVQVSLATARFNRNFHRLIGATTQHRLHKRSRFKRRQRLALRSNASVRNVFAKDVERAALIAGINESLTIDVYFDWQRGNLAFTQAPARRANHGC